MPARHRRSILGQPWRWRRDARRRRLATDDLVDQLLLARGVARDDLARHREPDHPRFHARPVGLPRHGQGRRAARRRGRGAARRSPSSAIMTSTARPRAALLILLLRQLGAEPIAYIPDRLMEGYGPSGEALVGSRRGGASLLVTVDCGAQAFEALAEAQAAGVDVIVVDHHKCAAALPTALRPGQPQPARRKRARAPRTAISPRSAWPSCSASRCSASCAAAAFSRPRRAEADRPARSRRARHRRRRRPAEEPQPRLRDPGAEGHGGRAATSASPR